MTRKDFQELADIVRAATVNPALADPYTGQIEWFAEQLADMCKRANPRFDRDKFYRACGLEEMAEN